jgi:hypothetical protein
MFVKINELQIAKRLLIAVDIITFS